MDKLVRHKFLLAAVVAIAFPGLLATTATASVDTILRDCNDDGALAGGYSGSDLRKALTSIPSDLKQYSNCESVIRQALLKKVTKNTSPKLKGGKAAGSVASINALTTPAQRKKIQEEVEQSAAVNPKKPLVAAGNPAIKQAAGNTLTSSEAPGVPTAVVIAIIAMLMLFAIDLVGRLGKTPRLNNLLPRFSRRGNG